VTYTSEAKRKILGVRRETIEGPGVVSEECAVEMARGARDLYESDVAVALTGVAGPEPHDGEPPGTVCIGLSARDQEESRCFRAPGDRDQIRRWAEQAGLDMVRRYLEGAPVSAELGPGTGAGAVAGTSS
jgi:nicotinamide-nucleotide amidase